MSYPPPGKRLRRVGATRNPVFRVLLTATILLSFAGAFWWWLALRQYQADARKLLRLLRRVDAMAQAEPSGQHLIPLLDASRAEFQGFLIRYAGGPFAHTASFTGLQTAWTALDASSRLGQTATTLAEPRFRARYDAQRRFIYERGHAALRRAERDL